MLKRGQVSTFVVISLVILIVVGGVVYAEWDYLKENWFTKFGLFVDVPKEVQPIHKHVMDCIKETSEVVLPYAAWQSGYYDLGKILNLDNVTYYLYGKTNLMPSKTFLEKELAKGMDKNLEYCLDFSSFESFAINIGKLKTAVEIKDLAVIFNVNYDLDIAKDNETFELNNFKYVMSVRYGKIFDAVAEHIKLEQEEEKTMCISCLIDISEKYNVHFETFKPVDDEVEFVMISNSDFINNRSLQFTYAVGYNK